MTDNNEHTDKRGRKEIIGIGDILKASAPTTDDVNRISERVWHNDKKSKTDKKFLIRFSRNSSINARGLWVALTGDGCRLL